jgi:hypothetical protein
MKRLLTTLVLALSSLTLLAVTATAQRRGDSLIDATGSLQLASKTPTLPCCECVGKQTAINLSSGQGGAIDPLWSINGGSAYVVTPYPGWILPTVPQLSPAKWMQPVNATAATSPIAAGDYKYTLRFNTPRCVIPNTVQLDVYFAADNTASVFVDGSQVPTTACAGICFKAPQAPVHFTTNLSSAPSHTLEFVVHNDGGASGLIVNARAVRTCAKDGAAISEQE